MRIVGGDLGRRRPAFLGGGGRPGRRCGGIEPESYESLRSLTSTADLVLRAQTGAVREGPSFGPADDLLVSLIVELEPLEVLAGDHPATEPVELMLPVGIEGDVDLAARVRQIEDADPEDAVYFLRSGTVLADIPGGSEQDEKLRGLYTVQTSQALIANRDGEAVFPGLESYEGQADGDPVASVLAGRPYPEALEAIEAEASWREENSEAAEAEREQVLGRAYSQPG